jgi:hypothetical protein
MLIRRRRSLPAGAIGDASPPRSEALAAAAILFASVGLRIAYSLRQSFDTDEPQHLHVAWAWTKGLVAYRDFFDNHTPLFHLAAAPLVYAVGERPELLLWARLAMLPIALALLACLAHLGRSLFSARAGVWAASLVAVLPSFLYESVEFRPDVAWATLWTAALVLWARGPLRAGRAAAVGVLLGLALATSVKTIFLAGSFALAWCAVAMLADGRLRLPRAGVIAAAVAGSAAVAAPGVWLLHAAGALPQAFDCLVRHNVSSVALWHERALRVGMFVATLPLLVFAARRVLRGRDPRSRRRAVLLLAAGLYYTTLNGFLPIVPTQNFLPLYPLAVAIACGFGLEALERGRPERGRAALLGSIAVAEIALLLAASPITKDRTRFERGLVADVLRLTAPDETVMDLKGESIFRRRPTRLVLERITEEHLRSGRLADDIAERLVASRTYVTVMDSDRLPPRARSFLSASYVPVGHLRVAGMLLARGPDGVARFDVALPGRYAVVSPRGAVAGVLDGTELRGSREMSAGAHWFRPAADEAPLALLWARAAERGFSPFRPNVDR